MLYGKVYIALFLILWKNNLASARYDEDDEDRSLCHLPCHKGSCHEKIPMWFYSSKDGDCYKFNFKGCGGNDNHFVDESDCRSFCIYKNLTAAKIPALGDKLHPLCFLPKVKGNCSENEERFYFNVDKGKCEMFTWEGCNSNPNNFLNKKTCKKICENPAQQEFELNNPSGWPKTPKKICRLPFRIRRIAACKNMLQEDKDSYFYYHSKFDMCREVLIHNKCRQNANAFSSRRKCEKTCVNRGFDDWSIITGRESENDNLKDEENEGNRQQHPDEHDYEDEDEESTKRPPKKCHGFQCEDGLQCIRKEHRCDGGKAQCRDGSDELGCRLFATCKLSSQTDFSMCGTRGKLKWHVYKEGRCMETRSTCCSERECFISYSQCHLACRGLEDTDLPENITSTTTWEPRPRPTPTPDENDFDELTPRRRPTEDNELDEPTQRPRPRPTEDNERDEPTQRPRPRPTEDNERDEPIQRPRPRPTEDNERNEPTTRPRPRPTEDYEPDEPTRRPRPTPTEDFEPDEPTEIPRPTPTEEDECDETTTRHIPTETEQIDNDTTPEHTTGPNEDGVDEVEGPVGATFDPDGKQYDIEPGHKRNRKIVITIRIPGKPDEIVELDSETLCSMPMKVAECHGGEENVLERFYFSEDGLCLPFYTKCCKNVNCFARMSDCKMVCEKRDTDAPLEEKCKAEDELENSRRDFDGKTYAVEKGNKRNPLVKITRKKLGDHEEEVFKMDAETLCFMPMKRGTCQDEDNNYQKRYYFSEVDGECKRFYTDCCKNENCFARKRLCVGICQKRFGKSLGGSIDTDEECELENLEDFDGKQYQIQPGHKRNPIFKITIRIPGRPAVIIERDAKTICHQPVERGKCTANSNYRERYYFNSEDGACRAFHTDCCKNDNCFAEKKQCEWICEERLGRNPGEVKEVDEEAEADNSDQDFDGKQYKIEPGNKKNPIIKITIYLPGGKREVVELDARTLCFEPMIRDTCWDTDADSKYRKRFYFSEEDGECKSFYTGCCKNHNCFAQKNSCKNICENRFGRGVGSSEVTAKGDKGNIDIWGPLRDLIEGSPGKNITITIDGDHVKVEHHDGTDPAEGKLDDGIKFDIGDLNVDVKGEKGGIKGGIGGGIKVGIGGGIKGGIGGGIKGGIGGGIKGGIGRKLKGDRYDDDYEDRRMRRPIHKEKGLRGNGGNGLSLDLGGGGFGIEMGGGHARGGISVFG